MYIIYIYMHIYIRRATERRGPPPGAHAMNRPVVSYTDLATTQR